ncbi:protein timeless homolog [Stegodyphus dumicola]|uniref:protein timeless homolog n=1 Tax=Stegodyphus dumicola TaxID=202533 RepID=UPI0015B0FBDA|nr:protein timeless homolog [Stegodyphus dumicola]
MTLEDLAEADILATCNALGVEINGAYEKGSDTVECLKDLLRYLRKDDDNFSILRYLGSLHLLQTDLLPLIKRYNHNSEIFNFTLRLLVTLTSPAILLFQDELPEDKLTWNVYLQLISYLQEYKRAFLDVKVWEALSENLKELLKQRPIERNEEENLTIERILIVIRNILHIPPDEKSLIRTDDDINLHDKILDNLHESKINFFLLYLAANEDEYEYCLHVLEIISLMFREHTAEVLATANEQRSAEEKEKDLKTLLAARQREQNIKLKKIQALCVSRFSGVYHVKHMKSLSENDYISHKLINNVNDVKFDIQKNAKRKPKNRLPAKDFTETRRSTLRIRLLLKNFCIEFLKTYNKLMEAVKRRLFRQNADENDDSFYLWAIRYFMEFNRRYDFQPAFVSETISMQIFHHIQTQITNYQEMMLSDKKKTNIWSKRMQLGVSAYKELLETLRMMERSHDAAIKHNADIIISRVFYVIEYREMLLSLLSHYDEVKFPLSYLSELVESAHLFLKMLENHSKRHSAIIVQKKKRKVKRRKKTKTNAPLESKNTEEHLHKEWDSVASDLSAAVQGRRKIPTDITPFDGASETTFEEQKEEAVYKIRDALVSKEVENAVGLLRAARELWPEGNCFGAPEIDSEDEFLVLREIFLSNLERNGSEKNGEQPEESDRDEEEAEEESTQRIAEQPLDLNDVYKKYTSPKIVQACCLLLANYQKNTTQTNICLIKLLHRIAWNCKMHAVFFQATVFVTFQKIFNDPDSNQDPIIKEFYRFAKYIVRKFFEVAAKNNKIFVEMLFWKGPREAYELEEGYGTGSSFASKSAWTEDEEEELRYLYEENKNIHIEGQDVADIILASMGKKRTKIQIILQLKRLGLIQSAKDLKPHLRKEWQEAEIIELQHLFEDHKGSNDVMGKLLNNLSIKRSRKAVVEKLLELNLIQDRKEVLKKRSKKHRNGRQSDSDSNSGEEGNDDSFINDDEPEVDNERNKKQRNKANIDSESDDGESELNFFNMLRAERRENDDNNVLEVWDEQEIIELHRLYEENADTEYTVDNILSAMISKRSKQSVVKKLTELGLIKGKKKIEKKKLDTNDQNQDMISFENLGVENEHCSTDSNAVEDTDELLPIRTWKTKQRIMSDSSSDEDDSVPPRKNSDLRMKKQKSSVQLNADKKNKNKRPSKVWDEKEIIELHKLFQENTGSEDIMGNILNAMTVKRPKLSVIEKLIEIGLIKDKKEVRKKRKTKLEGNSKSKKSVTSTSQIENCNDEHSASNFLSELQNADEVSQIKKVRKQQMVSDSSDDESLPLSKAHSLSKQKPRKKAVIKAWDEQDIVLLHHLFQEKQNSKDMIGEILNNLTVKRSRSSIIEKLLEMQLIKDKKEVRKQRESKESSSKEKKKDYRSAAKSKVNEKKGAKPQSLKSVSSESSEDESLPLSLIISSSSSEIQKTLQSNEINLEKEENSDSNNIKLDLIQENGFISSLAHVLKSDSDKTRMNAVINQSFIEEPAASVNLENNDNVYESEDDEVVLSKRKRPRIEDSDESDDKFTATKPISASAVNITELENPIINDLQDGENATNFKPKRKRLQVLVDSDDSE